MFVDTGSLNGGLNQTILRFLDLFFLPFALLQLISSVKSLFLAPLRILALLSETLVAGRMKFQLVVECRR